jgi:hypothetical protein
MREQTGEREPLRGVHIALDCANGAASQYAPVVLHELGAKVSLYAGEPDGDNINLNCGSTHLENSKAPCWRQMPTSESPLTATPIALFFAMSGATQWTGMPS